MAKPAKSPSFTTTSDSGATCFGIKANERAIFTKEVFTMTTARPGHIDRRRFVVTSALGGAVVLGTGSLLVARNITNQDMPPPTQRASTQALALASPPATPAATPLATPAATPAASPVVDRVLASTVPMYRGNAGRTDEMPGPAPDLGNGVEIRWQFTSEAGDVRSSPAVADGTVYFGSNDGNLYAVSLQEGAEIWRFPTGNLPHSNPAVADGTVFVGSEDGQCYAIDAKTGQERWRFAIGPDADSPAVMDGTVIICGGEQMRRSLYAINGRDGTERWRFSNDSSWFTAHAVADTRVFLTTGSYVSALDLHSGEERWRMTTEDHIGEGIVVASDTVYANDSGRLLALNAQDGTVRWRTPPDQFITGTIAVAGDSIFVGSSEYHTVVAVNADDGKRRWLYTIDGIEPDPAQPSRYGFSNLSVTDDTVFATRGFSEIYAIDKRAGSERWMLQLPSSGKTALSVPVVVDGLVLIGCQDGSMYALHAKVPSLSPGGTARVAGKTSLRGGPATTTVERAMLEPDTVVTITGESERTGNVAWWPVATDTGAQGWVEASKLGPLTSGPVATTEP